MSSANSDEKVHVTAQEYKEKIDEYDQKIAGLAGMEFLDETTQLLSHPNPTDGSKTNSQKSTGTDGKQKKVFKTPL